MLKARRSGGKHFRAREGDSPNLLMDSTALTRAGGRAGSSGRPRDWGAGRGGEGLRAQLRASRELRSNGRMWARTAGYAELAKRLRRSGEKISGCYWFSRAAHVSTKRACA
eukprot:5505811-Pleurochrysis_carterae.AAC.1